MERLTKKNDSGGHYYPKCFEKCNGLGASGECDDCEIMTSVCEKLGEYEDLEEQGRLMYSDHICTSDDVSDLFNLIDKQSTSYDTDDAVERLKKASYERFGNDGMGGELVVNLDDVIEIVKEGGKDE